ncbi:ATP-dependent Clp protease adaptor protein ClpS [Campylobacter sputorum subsp. bubulus]|uniref:ATP-dependent Clp protease adapter protein ClpS n=1 Tax=Campylobacter sputorum subsp. sputorum TaxID=32024 RepID=A0A381DH32_9BACT|nr:ATP-dependent Clp protease adaptor ClpS [Campylobacter sputorum]ASM35042.1 ATP-dependent Clp protease adaptor protein ClpS [Campylobacter sputorum aubsp. sputorum RM3237]ASM36708.1 ATP-dependent Clp protease adaptor protein ClpS [Campylobacter sputorum bv. faecalis CCUG 20703]ASM38398.1 ATP-dependent Clp protease adaptor protein ClpS [Campylobacter sputorum bv. paraureolyticus LMG 11764]KAB0581355.1 ATP-dependent Clp protease adaptor ClpS [Campylobacter sputorum subsp. sputorum]MDY6120794.1
MPQINEKIEQDIKFKEPNLYKILLLNDDVTSMDFVVQVLMDIFHHEASVAVDLMLKVHNEGSAVCGIYTKEIALSKQNEVSIAAKNASYPLQTILEEE